MQYHWKIGEMEKETLHLMSTKLCVPPHHTFFERFGHDKIHQPTLVCDLLEKYEPQISSGTNPIEIVLDETERAELLHELNALVERMDHENNNLAKLPTPSNPKADFWDFYGNASEVANELTVLKPSEE